MSEDTTVLSKWDEVKTAVSALEEDVVKNLVKGNASAGVRARKGLRSLRGQLTAIVKQSMEIAKAKKAEKPAKAPKADKPAKPAKVAKVAKVAKSA